MKRLPYQELVRRWRRVRKGELRAVGDSGGYPLFCWRHARAGAAHVYVSAGIHGDEPAGPMAVTLLLESFPRWFARLSWTVFPCLNPWGYERDSRRDRRGIDLNRLWRDSSAAEVRAVRAAVGRTRFDFAFNLHEDYDADGFYLYEVAPQVRPAGPQILQAVEKILPLETRRVIEGRRTSRPGLILRGADFQPRRRKRWPEAFYLIERHTAHLFTSETPSTGYPLEQRVRAQLRCLQAAVEAIVMA